MDIGDIAYYAVILVGLLISMWNQQQKKKKKQQEQQQRPQHNPDYTTFEPEEEPQSEVQTILDQILNANKPTPTPAPAPAPAPAPVAKTDYYASTDSHHENAENRKREMRENTRKATKMGSTIYDVDPFSIDQEVQEADFQFDLRQAVLYSEILRRPEF